MVTEEQLSEKNIEELIGIFIIKMSTIFHCLVQITDTIHTKEIKIKELKELKNNNQEPLLNCTITSTHINEYYSFMFNYNSFGWAIKQMNSFTKNIKVWKLITKKLYELVNFRNNLVHGWFCYEDNDLNWENLFFYREKFNIRDQKFEHVWKWNWREELISNILKSDMIFIIVWIINTQLKENETFIQIFWEYFNETLNVIKIPINFKK